MASKTKKSTNAEKKPNVEEDPDVEGEPCTDETQSQAVVLQIKKAIDQPANFLKLLITKSRAFEHFRKSLAGSALALALVDAAVSQISFQWLQQQFAEVARFVDTIKRLLVLARKLVSRKKNEPVEKFVCNLDAQEQGELAIAWILIANRNHREEVEAAWKISQAAKKASTSTDASSSRLVPRNLEGRYSLVNAPENSWAHRFGRPPGSPLEPIRTPWQIKLTREGIPLTVRIIPVSGHAACEGSLEGFNAGKLESELKRCVENENFPNLVRLEIISKSTLSRRASAEDVVARLSDDIRTLGLELFASRKKQPSVTIYERNTCFVRKFPSRVPALAPPEFHSLARRVGEFLREIQTGERADNFSAILIGEPGTGKTSGALQLALQFGLQVQIFTLEEFCNLTPNMVHGRTMILIEEFETSFEAALAKQKPQDRSNGLSRIYNLLDGSSHLQGCVVVFTANSIPLVLKQRYPAFFRVGRIDLVVTFPPNLTPERLQEAFDFKFGRDHPELCAAVPRYLDVLGSFAPAEVCELLRIMTFVWKSRSPADTADSVFQQVIGSMVQERETRASVASFSEVELKNK